MDRNAVDPGMFALVISDENGQNMLVPIRPTEQQLQRKRLEEEYVKLNDLILNIEEQNLVADMLLS